MGEGRNLLLRVDGGAGIGFGHLSRGLALVEAWTEAGGRATVVGRMPPAWAARFGAEGCEVKEPGGPLAAAAWGIVDGYHLSPTDRAQVREASRHLLLIDDHGLSDPSEADAIVDQNLGAEPGPYRSGPGDPVLLLGTRYALLRREFRTVAASPTRERAARLLVMLGGSPPAVAAELFEAALADPALRALEPIRLAGRDDVALVLSECDLALSAAGTTSWELCCSGLPAVLVPVAGNQEPVARRLAAAGVAVDAGRPDQTTPATLALLIAALAGDVDRRRNMASLGRQLVDGQGALRVLAHMRGQLLRLRPAGAGDARLLWTWANDPAVRMAAFHREPIPWEDHAAWFRYRLTDPDTRIYIADDQAGDPIGQVRFEASGTDRTAEVDVSVAPAHRGRRWGPALLEAATRRLFAETSVDEIRAHIRPDNVGSQRSFDLAGYERLGEGSDGEQEWVRYARRRDGPAA